MPTNWTPEREAALEKLCAEATPGPWERVDDNECTRDGRSDGPPAQEIHFREGWPLARCTIYSKPEDATFIATARTDLPDILAHTRKQSEVIRGLVGALEGIAAEGCSRRLQGGTCDRVISTILNQPPTDWCFPCQAAQALAAARELTDQIPRDLLVPDQTEAN